MLVCSVLRLGLFGSIILMIIVFGLMNNRKFNRKIGNIKRKVFRKSKVRSLKRRARASTESRVKHILEKIKL